MVVHEERLLNVREVTELIGVSRSTLHRMVSDNRFPRPIRVGLRAVRWRLSEVLAWMESCQPAMEDNWQ